MSDLTDNINNEISFPSIEDGIRVLNPECQYTLLTGKGYDGITFFKDETYTKEEIEEARNELFLELHKKEAYKDINESLDYYRSLFVRPQDAPALSLKARVARRILAAVEKSENPSRTYIEALSYEAGLKGITEIELRIKRKEDEYASILGIMEGIVRKGKKRIEEAETPEEVIAIKMDMKKEADEAFKKGATI